MKIENFRTESENSRKRVAATVTWEDCNRPRRDIYFETDEEFASGMNCNPDGFLIGCAMPALEHGEKRIALDGKISPEVLEGVQGAIEWIRHWRASRGRVAPKIEVKIENRSSAKHTHRRAGMFFSGGIDSLATIRANHLNYSSDHPWRIMDALTVFGLEMNDESIFRTVLNALSDVIRETGLTLIPVYTNVRDLENDWRFWGHVFHDAVFASIAHVFSRRLSVVSISSTYDIPNIQPFGSHPLLDVCYSSSDLLIRHDGITMSRLDKTRLVAEWDTALRNLRVCNQSHLYRADMLNCGACIKCVRAMVSLIALGFLDRTNAFPEHDVSPELLLTSIGIYRTTLCFYEELIEPLRERGRDDLADVIEKEIAKYLRHQEKYALKSSFREVIRRFDEDYLHSTIKNAKKGFFKKDS